MMGECQCSNIAIMQLFHELKQQFPALPDHVVSQCIAQNSHDKETCARSLRATQESRPSLGAFPPPAPDQQIGVDKTAREGTGSNRHLRRGSLNHHHRTTSLNGVNATKVATKNPNGYQPNVRAQRPASLDIGRILESRQCSRTNGRSRLTTNPTNCNETFEFANPGPLSAPPAFYPTKGFFEDLTNPVTTPIPNSKLVIETATTASVPTTISNDILHTPIVADNKPRNRGNQPTTTGFELNVNVACSSPAGNRVPTIGTAKRSDLVVEPRPHYIEPRGAQPGRPPSLLNHHHQQPQQQHHHLQDQARGYTSVSLTLRPPSSDPQPPIDIRSQGSSLTYSSSSLDPRGFQSRLQISIGPGSVGSVASARIGPPMGHIRPSSLVSQAQQHTSSPRPPGLPVGPSTQLSCPAATMSAPTTPSMPSIGVVQPTSLPTTPSTAPTTCSPPTGSHPREQIPTSLDMNRSPLNQVAEHQKKLVAEQLMRKERLAKELRMEKGRLEAMKRELRSLMKPLDSSISPQELKRKLRSEIYQLQVECDRLADEVDKRSDPRVPLGETNEEFYQGIYTGQPFAFGGNYVSGSTGTRSTEPPALPSRPPVWQLPSTSINHNVENTEERRENRNNDDGGGGGGGNDDNDEDDNDNDDWDERDGPSWVCRMCTFDNHPLMNKCEQCDMPRLLVHDTGETQDIHIRVTHHHNFSPRRTVHSWVV